LAVLDNNFARDQIAGPERVEHVHMLHFPRHRHGGHQAGYVLVFDQNLHLVAVDPENLAPHFIGFCAAARCSSDECGYDGYDPEVHTLMLCFL
jgi:hypothetical protein